MTDAPRLKTLLLRAADSFEDGVSGVNRCFLVENQVTFVESQALHDAIAQAIRLWTAEAFHNWEERRKQND